MRYWTSALLAILFAANARAAFTYADLEKIIRDHQVTTVDELLPLLPEDYRKYYTFVYQSRSAQHDNVFPEHPRVILYGGDAKLLMAFTKSPAESPAVNIDDIVETIEFDEKTERFVFRGLTFHKGKDPLNPPPQKNPATCLACHGREPRPNWDSYNIWPGVYGSLSRLNCDTAAKGTEERGFYEKFLAGNRKRGRYAHLPAEMKDASCPNGDDITVTNAAVPDPNADLTEKIFLLNARRLKTVFRQTPRYETFKYLWAATARNCWQRDPESFFPEGYAKDRGLDSYEETLKSVVAIGKSDFARRKARFSRTNRGSEKQSERQPVNFLDPDDPIGGSFGHRQQTQKLKFLADRSGINMGIERWATGFTDGTLDYATPHNYPDLVVSTIVGSLAPLTGESCEELQKKSKEAIAALR